jgi:hypothetical protein
MEKTMGTEMANCSVTGAAGWMLVGVGAFVAVFYINIIVGRMERSVAAWRDGLKIKKEIENANQP